ncbi:glycoside hydrolase family 92 protein [Lentithecium fluviatile CBS 122367]|uniref:Glycoside hydrolase family 92 protein n=1 Tax=Lentithecium fluviatile CBS 122367 TaxID=1168545 RepID=A0A6G1JFD1_9PLEO|nr:glycoside hydrolase family 92 protein [Lentithecium fluviatile CBS 122367]
MVWTTVFTLLIASQAVADQVDYTQYVNPFIGSEGPIPGYAYGGGDIFVGAAVPFGVVKLGIDTQEDNLTLATINGGYTPKGLVTGVSMLHVSGTGGCPKYGIISQMPLPSVAAPVNLLDNITYWQKRVGEDVASVGWFSTELEDGIKISLTGSRHAGTMRYDFPGEEKHVLVDVSHFLPDPAGGFCTQYYLDGSIEISDDGKAYAGHGTYAGGFNFGAPYTVYFCGEFEAAPDEARTFTGLNTSRIMDGSIPQPVFSENSAAAGPNGDRVGALFSWTGLNGSVVQSKVGVSFISIEKACAFKGSEIPSWKQDDGVRAARDEWNTDVLSRIRVDTGESANMKNLILLYSSLYFMHLMPSDRTGENPLWESDEPSWDDFYCIWDTFRNTFSLSHLIQPEAYERQIRALIDIWRHQGYLPDGRSGNDNGLTQGGSNADNVLADAYIKGLRGAINWADGYAAMVKDAEVSTNGSNKEGRGALDDWLNYGYLTEASERSISRTVEYAPNDFALSQVAKGVQPEDVEKYLKRSAGWQLLWDHTVPSVNTTPTFTGFLTPKSADGMFNTTDYNPATCGVCSWPSVTYEGTPFEYSFVIPHDLQTLIEFMGGEEAFESRLDYIFKPNTSQTNLGANGLGITTIMNIGNEPDFATPYLYNYINKQWKSVNQSRALAQQFFKNAPFGVPGNSDSGALNSWLIWQMLGLYPIVTQPIYLLASPWFPDINMTVNGNRTLRVTAKGLDEDSYFVQGVKINGEQWEKNWFEHEDVMVEGGTIEFSLGKEAMVWETGEVPSSPGHLILDGSMAQ